MVERSFRLRMLTGGIEADSLSRVEHAERSRQPRPRGDALPSSTGSADASSDRGTTVVLRTFSRTLISLRVRACVVSRGACRYPHRCHKRLAGQADAASAREGFTKAQDDARRRKASGVEMRHTKGIRIHQTDEAREHRR